MAVENTNWTRWPHPAAVGDPRLGAREKRSELDVRYEECTPEYLLRGVVFDLPEWESELPSGIEKTAAQRFGTTDDLPTVTTKNIWRHPNAHPAVLMLLLMDKYGPDYVHWEPEALRTTLRKDGILLSDSVWTKILAARVLLASGAPWRQWEQFHWVATGLMGRPPSFVYMERPELGALMAAVDIMKMFDKSRPFAEDIGKFITGVLKDRGIAYAPPPLQFAQEELDDSRIHCGQCGTEEKDDNDLKCVACGSTDLKRVAGFYEKLREETKVIFAARKGKPLEEAVDGLDEDAVGESVYKLLVHNEYRNQLRAQLLAQLRMLKAE